MTHNKVVTGASAVATLRPTSFCIPDRGLALTRGLVTVWSVGPYCLAQDTTVAGRFIMKMTAEDMADNRPTIGSANASSTYTAA
jgi:hypothetical protein